MTESFTHAKVVGSNPVQSLKFFQVIFPVVLWLHSHPSFFHYLIATDGHLLPFTPSGGLTPPEKKGKTQTHTCMFQYGCRSNVK